MQEEIIKKAGWVDLGVQKQKAVKSYKKGKFRMNIWESTGTVQIQDTTKTFDKGEIFRDTPLNYILQSY